MKESEYLQDFVLCLFCEELEAYKKLLWDNREYGTWDGEGDTYFQEWLSSLIYTPDLEAPDWWNLYDVPEAKQVTKALIQQCEKIRSAFKRAYRIDRGGTLARIVTWCYKIPFKMPDGTVVQGHCSSYDVSHYCS